MVVGLVTRLLLAWYKFVISIWVLDAIQIGTTIVYYRLYFIIALHCSESDWPIAITALAFLCAYVTHTKLYHA